MAGFEQTIIIGNLGRDPEMKFLPSGIAVTNFSVAVTTSWTDKNTGERNERVNWYKCAAWGKQAEIANQYLKKGRQVMVQGTPEARAYMGKDGEPKASLELRVQSFQFLGSRDSNSAEQQSNSQSPVDNDDNDDIPF